MFLESPDHFAAPKLNISVEATWSQLLQVVVAIERVYRAAIRHMISISRDFIDRFPS